MTVSLNLPVDVERRIVLEAASRSLGVEEYILSVLSDLQIEPDEVERRRRAAEGIRRLRDIGTDQEQKETFAALSAAIDEDRLSDRKLFS